MAIKQISPVGLVELLNKLAELVMINVPDQKYSDDNGVLGKIARDVLKNKPEMVTRENLEILLNFRQEFEKKIDKKYKTKLITGMSSFTQDVQVVYNTKKVIKPTQIKSGILDCLIGEVNNKIQKLPTNLWL